MPNNQSNYMRIRIGGTTYALCLVPNGSGNPNMGGIPHIRRGGVTYDIYLLNVGDSFASPARMRTSGGTKAVRYYTQHNDASHGDGAHSDAAPHTNVAHNDHSNNTHSDAVYHFDTAHSDFNYGDFSNVPHTDIAHQDSMGHSDVAHTDIAHNDGVNHENYTDWPYYQDWWYEDSFGDYPDGSGGGHSNYNDHADTSFGDTAHSDYGVPHTDSWTHQNYTDWPYYQDWSYEDTFGDYPDGSSGGHVNYNDHADTTGGQHGDSAHYDTAHSNAGTYHNHEDAYWHDDYWGYPHSDVPHSDESNVHYNSGYNDHSDTHTDFNNHSNIAHVDNSHVDSETIPTF